MNKVVLWAVTAMAVAFLLFPHYAGAFLQDERSPQTGSMIRSVFAINGMTCKGCSIGINFSIHSVPGVSDVEIDFESGQAIVTTSAPVPSAKIITAIESAGFQGEVLKTNAESVSLENPNN